jgi:hypothetical protein
MSQTLQVIPLSATPTESLLLLIRGPQILTAIIAGFGALMMIKKYNSSNAEGLTYSKTKIIAVPEVPVYCCCVSK